MSEVKDAASKAEKKAPVLKERIRALSEKIITSLEPDTTNGTIGQTGEPYYENLPEGLTRETSDAVDAYRSDFMAASAHAAGMMAVTMMTDHTDLQQVVATLDVGKADEASHLIKREAVYKVGNADPVVRPGAMTSSLKCRAASNVGELAKVRTLISDYAREQLTGK